MDAAWELAAPAADAWFQAVSIWVMRIRHISLSINVTRDTRCCVRQKRVPM
jgi:hypothetical protein